MNILITAPSLETTRNVSGISSVVNTIVAENPEHRYFHFELGRPDSGEHRLVGILKLAGRIGYFPILLYQRRIQLMHLNLPFNKRGILRDYCFHFLCSLCRIPVLLHIHGGEYLMEGTKNRVVNRMAKKMFRNSKVVIVLSELERTALQQEHHFSLAKVLPNAVLSCYNKISVSSLSSLPTLLFLGRIHESKGIRPLLRALAILRDRVAFRFILCGAGPLQDQVVQECSALLGDYFEYRGVVSGEQKLAVIQESDIFLLPSLYGEGLPVALLETMAAGLVPVVTNDGSIGTLVEDGVNGLIVDKNDDVQLSEKLFTLLQNLELLRRLSAAAHNSVVSKHNSQTYIRQLNALYQEVLQR